MTALHTNRVCTTGMHKNRPVCDWKGRAGLDEQLAFMPGKEDKEGGDTPSRTGGEYIRSSERNNVSAGGQKLRI